MDDLAARRLDGELAQRLAAADVPPARLWDPAPTCRMGHPADLWAHLRDPGRPVAPGGLCVACLLGSDPRWRSGQGVPLVEIAAALEAFDRDPAWHPEWRIPAAPKRFTRQWDAIWLAVEAWIAVRAVAGEDWAWAVRQRGAAMPPPSRASMAARGGRAAGGWSARGRGLRRPWRWPWRPPWMPR